MSKTSTKALMMPAVEAWCEHLGQHQAVPVVLIGLGPDGRLHYCAPPDDVQSMEELAESLAMVADAVRKGQGHAPSPRDIPGT